MARKLPMIEIGFHVFPQGGDEEVGAVREVAPGGRPELVVDIENAGDFVIPLDAVTDVLVELRQRGCTEDDFVGRIECVPGQQGRCHRGIGALTQDRHRLAVDP